jgi:hypothetical protein
MPEKVFIGFQTRFDAQVDFGTQAIPQVSER